MDERYYDLRVFHKKQNVESIVDNMQDIIMKFLEDEKSGDLAYLMEEIRYHIKEVDALSEDGRSSLVTSNMASAWVKLFYVAINLHCPEREKISRYLFPFLQRLGNAPYEVAEDDK